MVYSISKAFLYLCTLIFLRQDKKTAFFNVNKEKDFIYCDRNVPLSGTY